MIGALKISTDEAFTLPLATCLAQDYTKAEGLLSIAGVIILMLLLGKLGRVGQICGSTKLRVNLGNRVLFILCLHFYTQINI